MMRLPPKQPRGTIKYKKRYDRDVCANRGAFACVSLLDIDKTLNGERSFGKATGYL